MKKIVIDGTYILRKSFIGYKKQTNTKGEHIGGFYGFLVDLSRLYEVYPQAEIYVVFDSYDEEKFSSHEFYKANREKQTKDYYRRLNFNQDLIMRFLGTIGIPVVRLPQVEGDDLVGSIAYQFAKQGFETIMVSIDTDFFHLTGENLSIFQPRVADREEQIITEFEACAKFKVSSSKKINMVRALAGDTSDGIPSVNKYYSEHGVDQKRVQIKDYLPLVLESDTVDSLREKLKNLDKFKFFVESGQFDINYNLLTIDISCADINLVELLKKAAQEFVDYDEARKTLAKVDPAFVPTLIPEEFQTNSQSINSNSLMTRF